MKREWHTMTPHEQVEYARKALGVAEWDARRCHREGRPQREVDDAVEQVWRWRANLEAATRRAKEASS